MTLEGLKLVGVEGKGLVSAEKVMDTWGRGHHYILGQGAQSSVIKMKRWVEWEYIVGDDWWGYRQKRGGE